MRGTKRGKGGKKRESPVTVTPGLLQEPLGVGEQGGLLARKGGGCARCAPPEGHPPAVPRLRGCRMEEAHLGRGKGQ